MKVGFTNSPFFGNKIVAIYAVAMTAVAGVILLQPAAGPAPNVVYNVFKIGQTSADPAQLASGWKPVGYACQAANPSQIAQGLGPQVCGYRYTTATHNSITIGGIDWLTCRMAMQGQGGASRCTLLTQYIALSTDATAIPSPNTDCATGSSACTLTAELIATSCGSGASGMNRALGTIAVTGNNDSANAATNSYTVVKTFTAGASASCVGVQKSGLFTKLASGTMVFENTFSSTNLIAGDTLQITWTVTV